MQLNIYTQIYKIVYTHMRLIYVHVGPSYTERGRETFHNLKEQN